MLKKQFLILFLFGTSCLFSMQQDNITQNQDSQEEIDTEKQTEQDKVPPLVLQCAKAVAKFLLYSKKYPNFTFNLNSIPQDVREDFFTACAKWMVHLIWNTQNSDLFSLSDNLPKELRKVIENTLFEDTRTWKILKNHITCQILDHGVDDGDGKDNLHAIAYNLKNKTIATSNDRNIKIWDVESAKCLKTINRKYKDNVILPSLLMIDKKLVLSKSDKNAPKIWALKPNDVSLTLIDDDWILSRKGHLFYLNAAKSKTLEIWNDLNSEKLSLILDGHNASISAFTLSQNTKFIVTGSYDNSVKLWDSQTGYCLLTFSGKDGHTFWISAVAISANNKFIISGSYDCTVKVWSIGTGQCLDTLSDHFDPLYPSKGWIETIAISPDSRFIITGSWDHTTKIWSTKSGCCLHTLAGHKEGISTVVINLEGNLIISGSWDRTVRMWKIN